MIKRNTIQKQMVLDAVVSLHNHPTAEEVYAHVVIKHPTISKATVYRNLAGLAQDGQLTHIRVPDGADRFDHTLEEHYHITCNECGLVYDAPAKDAKQVNEMVAKATGFSNVAHSIVFNGVCSDCAKKSLNKS